MYVPVSLRRTDQVHTSIEHWHTDEEYQYMRLDRAARVAVTSIIARN
jgi:hypothetical protein